MQLVSQSPVQLRTYDVEVLRKHSFKNWEEIISAVLERRLHIVNVQEERLGWFDIQRRLGVEE